MGSRRNRSESDHWRKVRCTGCARECRYVLYRTQEFKGHVDGGIFKKALELMKENQDDSAKWKYKRVHGILGSMHAIKREAWERDIRACMAHMEEMGLEVGLGVHPTPIICKVCGSQRVERGAGRACTCRACGARWEMRSSWRRRLDAEDKHGAQR